MNNSTVDASLVIERGAVRSGKTKLTAKLGDRTVHVARCDMSKPEDRAAFAAAVAKDRPGIDAGAIERELLEVAGGEEEKEASQSTQLVELATAWCELWHTPDNDAYATMNAGHREHWRIRTKAFRQWLAGQFFRAYQKAPGSEAIQAAVNVLEGMALFAQPSDHKSRYPGQPAPGCEHTVHVRLAEQGGVLYLDLCDVSWRAVVITPDGWRVGDDHLARFRRAKGMLPLPEPVQGGSVEDLRRFVNVSDDDWPLVLGWLLAALRPSGPYPVLCLHGEQGSAKSTTAKVLRALIDPSGAPLRSEPKEPRDLMIAASNSAVVAYDNLSHVPAWLSDALCRLSTGGGFSTRELYTDAEETIFDAVRPVILTGIEELATRSDLLDRTLLVTLPRISEDRRRPESEFWAEFNEVAPSILGALLTAVSCAMRNLSAVKLSRLPRMADFALWVTAGEQALGLAEGAFMAAYQGNRQGANDLALEASPVGKVVLDFLAKTSAWSGTASELLSELEKLADDKTTRLKGWPQTPRALSGIIKRLAPNLRAVGIGVEFGTEGRGRNKRRRITIRKEAETSVPSVPNSAKQGSCGDDPGLVGDDAGTPAAIAASRCTATAGTIGDDGDGNLRPRSRRERATI
jgi:hypothetical protein